MNEAKMILEQLKELNGKIDDLQTEVKEVKTEVKELKTEVAGVKTEVKKLKTEVSEVKEETTGIRSNLSELRQISRGIEENAQFWGALKERVDILSYNNENLQFDINKNFVRKEKILKAIEELKKAL